MKPTLRACLLVIRKILKSKSFLFLLNGILLASLFYAYSEDNYEEQLFKVIAVSVSQGLPTSNSAREDTIIARSLDLSYRLLKRRMSIFGHADLKGFKAEILQPVSFDLMTGKGACGGNSYVLGRILQEFNMDIRFPQMKVEGKYGGHILVETKSSEGWKVLDPVYNLSFKRPDGKLASFEDVQANWNYYKQQVPPQYKMIYSYEGVRYTNWNKIPVLMPLIKQVLYLIKGKKTTDHLSLRSFALKKYKLVFNVILIVYLSLSFYMIRLFARWRKKPILVKMYKSKRALAASYN